MINKKLNYFLSPSPDDVVDFIPIFPPVDV